VSLTVEHVDPSQGRAKVVRAKAFRSCSGLVGYARRHALRTVSRRDLVSPVPVRAPLAVPLTGPERGAIEAPASSPAAPDHSPTNVQEAGVDEPDIVKADGSRLFAIAAGKLRAVDLTGAEPRLLGSISLEGSGHQLLLHGDRLLVVSGSYGEVEPLRGEGVQPVKSEALLAEVDVSDPAAMRVVRTLTVDGSHVSSRLNGVTARVVVASQPRALGLPTATESGAEDASATQERLKRSRTSHWLPSYVLRNRRTGRSARHRLVRCRAVRRAASFSGLDTLTVLTIDLAKGLTPVDSDGLMTDAQTVYASPESLYVATQRWVDPSVPARQVGGSTAIHKFATGERDRTVYRASGEVPGFLLNQFSLSEHRGFLRVASTAEPVWLEQGAGRESESFVTVLEDRSGRLVEVGRVGGLGRGERIHSVRFIGDAGFVVTFRQTDPLYTVDLSNPSRPAVLGELKILGYSAYLHPIGNDLLLGVGQDATEQGRALGTQISLFDISDLRRPARLHQRAVGSASSSEVGYDHHAFLYWPPARLAVMPLDVYGFGRDGAQPFTGAIGFRIGRESGIEEAGRVSHDAGEVRLPVRRALVAGGRLITVFEGGVEVNDLETLAERAWVPFE
jgi:beta propeller domain-containing protein